MKKILCLVISLITIVCCGMAVSADSGAGFYLECDKTSVKPGDEISVKIKLSNTTGKGVAAFDFNMSYDETCFKYVSAEKAEALKDKDFTVVKSTLYDGLVAGVYVETVAMDVNTTDLCTLKFKVTDKAPGGNSRMFFSKGSLCDAETNDMTAQSFRDINFSIVSDYTRKPTTGKVEGGTSVEYVPVTQKVTDSKGQVVTNAAGQAVTETVTDKSGNTVTTAVIHKVGASQSVSGAVSPGHQSDNNNKNPLSSPVVWIIIAVAVVGIVVYILITFRKKKQQ